MDNLNKITMVEVSPTHKKIYRYVITTLFPNFVQHRYIGAIKYDTKRDEISFVPSDFVISIRQSSIAYIDQEMKKMRKALDERRR